MSVGSAEDRSAEDWMGRYMLGFDDKTCAAGGAVELKIEASFNRLWPGRDGIPPACLPSCCPSCSCLGFPLVLLVRHHLQSADFPATIGYHRFLLNLGHSAQRCHHIRQPQVQKLKCSELMPLDEIQTSTPQVNTMFRMGERVMSKDGQDTLFTFS